MTRSAHGKAQRQAALNAWEAGKCSDDQLELAIEAVDDTLDTLRSLGCNWVLLVGLQTALNSMEAARDSRKRK